MASPVVGTVHVEPFVKEKIGELVSEYKENYDYRTDVFPAQVLENGTYYIMYNGKYLSNTRPRVSASVPQFVTGKDTIRPQRQEWKITLDAATGRYKIVNLEDNRYLNEKGAFTVSDETNPYEAAWHSYNIQLLANGKFAIQNAGSAGDKFWTANATRVSTGSSNVNIPDKYIFDIVALGSDKEQPSIVSGDTYYIMSGDKYLTNTNINGSGGTPTFKQIKKVGKPQEWVITTDASGKSCYKIVSGADKRYLNEYGVFGTNQYYSDWNTYMITKRGDKFSIAWTQSAAENGVKYIVVSGDRLEAKSVSLGESYTVSIVNKNDATSIESTTDEGVQVWYDAASESILCSNISDGSNVAVVTASGAVVCRATASGNSAQINMINHPSGIYIVTIENNNDRNAYKILKQ
jgi:hypothetical protein